MSFPRKRKQGEGALVVRRSRRGEDGSLSVEGRFKVGGGDEKAKADVLTPNKD